jgi:hypothetical protein
MKFNDCPYCHEKLGDATGLNHWQVPKPGDVSVCAYCGGFLIFTEPYVVRALTDDEYQALPIMQRIFIDKIADGVRKYRALEKHKNNNGEQVVR